MVSTRSSTIPAVPSAGNSPTEQSITLQQPPPAEEQLLNQQLNAGQQQPEVNLAGLLLHQSQLLQQMECRLANLKGQLPIQSPAVPLVQAPVPLVQASVPLAPPAPAPVPRHPQCKHP